MAEQQNINQFGREELIDILQYLYVQGSQILYYKKEIPKFEGKYRQKRWGEINGAANKRCLTYAAIIATIINIYLLFSDSGSGIGSIIFALIVGTSFFTFIFFFVLSFFGLGIPKGKKRAEFEKNIEDEIFNNQEINQMKQIQQSLTMDNIYNYYISLIPDNFANLTDFAGMLVLLQDFRATNFQEAANLWRTEQHQQSVMNQQKKMAEQLARSNAQISQLRDQAERLRKGQAHLEDAAARVAIQNARANEKLANMERYGVHATIR
ncbi:TPA: hypothetical protein TXL34_001874 [Streptococcus suis]|nr:hypothetical protein [Streptococcus suis]